MNSSYTAYTGLISLVISGAKEIPFYGKLDKVRRASHFTGKKFYTFGFHFTDVLWLCGEVRSKHDNPIQRTEFFKSYKTLTKTSSLSFLGGWRKNEHILMIIKDFSAFVIYSIDKIVEWVTALPSTNIFVSNKAKLQTINYCSGGRSPPCPPVRAVQYFMESYV